jgi:hypothetical protein
MYNGTEWLKTYSSEFILSTKVNGSFTLGATSLYVFSQENNAIFTVSQNPKDAQTHMVKALHTGVTLIDGAAGNGIDGAATVTLALNDAVTIQYVEDLDTWKIIDWYVDIP